MSAAVAMANGTGGTRAQDSLTWWQQQSHPKILVSVVKKGVHPARSQAASVVLPIQTKAEESSGKTLNPNTENTQTAGGECTHSLLSAPSSTSPAHLSRPSLLLSPGSVGINPAASFLPAHPSRRLPPPARCAASPPAWLIADAVQDAGSGGGRQGAGSSAFPRAWPVSRRGWTCWWHGGALTPGLGAQRALASLCCCCCRTWAQPGHPPFSLRIPGTDDSLRYPPCSTARQTPPAQQMLCGKPQWHSSCPSGRVPRACTQH